MPNGPSRRQTPGRTIIIVALLGFLLLYLLLSWSTIAGFVSEAPENAALVTALLAFAGVLIAQVVNARIARSAQRIQQELEEQRALVEALQAYLEKVEKSLTDKKLHKSGQGSYLSRVTEAQTAALLEWSDGIRKRILIQFLYRAGLLNVEEPLLELDGANLEGVELTGVNLSKVCLRRANLMRAHMTGADLSTPPQADRWSDLSYVDLRGANLTNADLSNVDLTGVNLLPYNEQDPSRLSFVNLKHHALPSDAELRWAKQQEQRKRRRSRISRLTGIPLDRLMPTKPVTFTNLTDTKLVGANLTGAILANADLRKVRGLSQEQVDSAIGNSETKLPNHLKHPRAWAAESIEGQILAKSEKEVRGLQ
jgi:uncharacterized protein YjbI with pentapeptide repeats